MNSDHVTLWLGNGASLAAIAAAFFGWVPIIAALIAAIWYAVQIYESATVQRWRKARLRRRLERMHQKAVELEMLLVDVTDHGTMDHLKKMIAMRVDVDAGLRARELNHERANKLAKKAAEEHAIAKAAEAPAPSPPAGD